MLFNLGIIAKLISIIPHRFIDFIYTKKNYLLFMYNMDISIFGFKLNLEILILIGVVYLILIGHTLCGCSNYGLMESLEMMDKTVENIDDIQPITENFTGANTNYGESSSFDLTNDQPINTASWSAQNMTVVPGQPLSQGVKDFLAREPQQVPLPEGEMLMFANTPFKPECCPNTYSNSSGCACMTGPQYNFLVQRGMNNVPYSEY
jgi:hypothetical protein